MSISELQSSDSEDPDDSKDDVQSDSSEMGDFIEHSYELLFVPGTDVECVTVQSKYRIQCNYDINRLTISAFFYRELLDWWSKLREVKDPENVHKYILWNNKEIRIDGKSVFYKHFFYNNIIYTTQLLYEMTNIESFNVVKDAGLKNSNFLVWTGLRQSVPLRLHVHAPNFENILDLEHCKCRDYYHLLIKQKLFVLGHFSFNRNKTETAVTTNKSYAVQANVCNCCLRFVSTLPLLRGGGGGGVMKRGKLTDL